MLMMCHPKCVFLTRANVVDLCTQKVLQHGGFAGSTGGRLMQSSSTC